MVRQLDRVKLLFSGGVSVGDKDGVASGAGDLEPAVNRAVGGENGRYLARWSASVDGRAEELNPVHVIPVRAEDDAITGRHKVRGVRGATRHLSLIHI